MFNILTDDLPKSVMIDGREYAIRWWFRAIIKIEAVLQDPEIDMKERRALALNLFYPEIPSNIIEAERQMFAFYTSDKPRNRKQQAEMKRHEGRPPVYSYDFDDDYIYAAFRQQYGINLNIVEGLHWFEFRAMLVALDDCVFTTIKGYRGTELSKIKDEQMRRHYAELKELWELPGLQCDQAAVNEMEELLMNGGDLTEYRRRHGYG